MNKSEAKSKLEGRDSICLLGRAQTSFRTLTTLKSSMQKECKQDLCDLHWDKQVEAKAAESKHIKETYRRTGKKRQLKKRMYPANETTIQK